MNKLAKAGIGLAAVAATTAAGIFVASAFGPSDRATFTMDKPADYITFNSITNNVIGDERYFVAASEWTGNANDNYFSDQTKVEDGKEYVIRMYVHNNAAADLKLVAENVKAFVVLPTETATSITISGKISADNAKPKSVWDETVLTSKNGEKFNLAYVDGSATYANADQNGKLRSFKLGKSLFDANGVLLGYDQMDGKIPGCNAYSGYLTFHVKAQFAQKTPEKHPNAEIQKEVKILGTDTWSEQVKAKGGDTVRYRIHVKNSGDTDLENFSVRDILPAGLTYVAGSTSITNTAHPKGIALGDGIASDKGINLGTYAAGAGAYLYFNATVDQAVAEKCENTLLRNIAQTSAGTVIGTKEDTADVLVDGKTCHEDPNFTINKTVQVNGGKEWVENVKVNAGDKVRYRIQFKNTGDTTLKNVVIRDILPNGIGYVKGTTMLYNAANTNGKKLADGIVTADGINIGDYDKGTEATVYFYATVNESLKDNCNDSTLTNVAKGKYNNDSKTEKTDTANVTVAGKTCKDTPPTTPENPTTPPELPKTGAGSIVAGVMGVASVSTAAGYYIISRKKLN